MKNKTLAALGEELYSGKPVSPTCLGKLSVPSASLLMSETKMGKQKYQLISAIFKREGFDILPSYLDVSSFRKAITPSTMALPEPFLGIKFPLVEAVKTALLRTIMYNVAPKDKNLLLFDKLKFIIKVGFDGSGQHNMFHQQGTAETTNIIMTMMVPLTLRGQLKPSSPEEIIWSEQNPSSANTQRPLALQLGKENIENLMMFGIQSQEMNDLEARGVEVDVGGHEINVGVLFRLTAIDRKATDAVLSVGGSYCDLCLLSKEEAHETGCIPDLAVVRTLESIKQIAENLPKDSDGNLKTRKGDYGTRQGVMRAPITQHEIESVQALHMVLRTADWCLKLVYHERAGLLLWSEAVDVRGTEFSKQAKFEIQNYMRKHTGLRVDYPNPSGGTTTTGNVARRLLHDPATRKELLSQIPDHLRGNLGELLKRISIVLRVISTKAKVEKLEEFRSYSLKTYQFVLETYAPPRCFISPTVHKALGHGWELIRKNEGNGLGILSEGGLEASNKLLRNIRIDQARKVSQETNLQDCISKLWVRSDPEVEKIRCRVLPRCQACSTRGHSKAECPNIVRVLKCEDEMVQYFLMK